MRIAPLGRVDAADVVAADEGGLAIHNQQLAMVKRIAPWHEQMTRAADGAVAQRVDVGREALERAWHDEIAKEVEYHVDGDAFGGLPQQMLLEFSADRIILPDVGLEVDAVSRGINGIEHRPIDIAPVGVDLERIA